MNSNISDVYNAFENFQYFRDESILGGDTVIASMYNVNETDTSDAYRLIYDIFIEEQYPMPTVRTEAGGSKGFINGEYYYAEFSEPVGIAIDDSDNPQIYIADTLNHAIRIVNNNTVETIAGDGTIGYADGMNAKFNRPTGISLSL